MSFDEVQFPINISYGSDGGPVRQTNIVTLANGYEERNSDWSQSRHQFNVAYGIKNYNDMHTVKEFFEARRGALYGFRYKDWSDYKSCAPQSTISDTDQLIGTGDGTTTTFQLIKKYTSGARTYNRDIKKPVSGTTVISLNDVSQASGWTINTTTGIVTFTIAPGSGVEVKAGFEFDVPVRFDNDQLNLQLSSYNFGDVFDIFLIEVRV